MQTKNAIVDSINIDLLKHGSARFGNPIFRVVFSADEVEKRKGTFEEYSNGIFLRTVTGVREVPKYPYFKQGRWILERWAGPELSYHPDVVSAPNGDYLCVYVFQDKNGNYLPPHAKVVEILVRNLLNPRPRLVALNEDFYASENEDKVEEERLYQRIRENYEATATEVETMSLSKYVEADKQTSSTMKESKSE
jgi:hypothetical protein